MKILRPTLFALSITLMISSTAFAGNIGGLRATGNIGGMRSAGNIGGMRSAGNIGGTRTTGLVSDTTAPSLDRSRFELGTSFSGTFAGLLRMLLESGALL